MKAKPSFNILLRVVLRVVRHPSGIAAQAYRSGARHASDGSPMLRSSSSKNGARLCRSHARCPANGPAGPFGTAASPGNRKRAAASYTCNHPGQRLRGRSPADRRASVRADKPRNPHDIGSAGGRLRVFARRAGATGTGRRTPAPGRPCAEKPRGAALPAPDGAQAGRGSAGGNGAPPKPCEGQSPPPADKPQIRSEPGPEAPPRSKKTSIRMSAPSAGLRPRTVPGPARLPSVLSRRMPRRYAASASSPHRERAQSSGSATSRPSSREAHIRKRFREREAGGGIKRGCPKRIRQPLSESGFRSFLRGPTSFLQPQIVTRERERTADQCAQEIEYLGRHPAP